ncbi:MAG: hypothetical protein ACPGUV_05735 [Polyangiales bacterium]
MFSTLTDLQSEVSSIKSIGKLTSISQVISIALVTSCAAPLPAQSATTKSTCADKEDDCDPLQIIAALEQLIAIHFVEGQDLNARLPREQRLVRKQKWDAEINTKRSQLARLIEAGTWTREQVCDLLAEARDRIATRADGLRQHAMDLALPPVSRDMQESMNVLWRRVVPYLLNPRCESLQGPSLAWISLPSLVHTTYQDHCELATFAEQRSASALRRWQTYFGCLPHEDEEWGGDAPQNPSGDPWPSFPSDNIVAACSQP